MIDTWEQLTMMRKILNGDLGDRFWTAVSIADGYVEYYQDTGKLSLTLLGIQALTEGERFAEDLAREYAMRKAGD